MVAQQGGKLSTGQGPRRLAGVFACMGVSLVLGFALYLPTALPQAAQQPETTARRLREPGWWPTKGDAGRKDYAGSESCAKCHTQAFASQQKSSMARAAFAARDSAVLRSNSKLTSEMPPFLTQITRDRGGSTYVTSRGGEAIRGQVLWAFGDGVMGQTFILESAGSLYESQLSYFSSIGGLDLTPGHSRRGPQDVERAFGERQSPGAAAECFACHTTQATVRGQFDAGHAIAGVGCEVCHGPGARHVGAMERNQLEQGRASILQPGAFDPVKLVDYCGACHRAPLDVAAEKAYAPINVRFQPYRLSKSRCWSQPDRRLTCVACHNPHEQVERDAAFYDAKCVACHRLKDVSESAGKLPACPVSSARCTSCHMPKYLVPQMHGSFTDHDIRIVRAGEAYPL